MNELHFTVRCERCGDTVSGLTEPAARGILTRHDCRDGPDLPGQQIDLPL